MHELPLVIFTVLTQTAVGAFTILLIANLLKQITDRQLAIGLFISMCLFGIGAFASMAHLGQLSRAFNTLSGIGRSPMSNEILLVALFSIVGGLTSLFMLINKKAFSTLKIVAIVAAAIGLAFTFVVPQVYSIATVNTWSNTYTMINMLLTVLIVGGAFAALMGAVQIGSCISAIAIIISLALKPGYFAEIWQASSLLSAEQIPFFTVQFALLATGGVVSAFVASKGCTSKMLLTTCFAVLLIAELSGRIAFYNLWAIPM